MAGEEDNTIIKLWAKTQEILHYRQLSICVTRSTSKEAKKCALRGTKRQSIVGGCLMSRNPLIPTLILIAFPFSELSVLCPTYLCNVGSDEIPLILASVDYLFVIYLAYFFRATLLLLLRGWGRRWWWATFNKRNHRFPGSETAHSTHLWGYNLNKFHTFSWRSRWQRRGPGMDGQEKKWVASICLSESWGDL